MDPKAVAQEYGEQKYALYSEFAARLRALVCEIADSSAIEIAHSESRAKSPTSLLRKLELGGYEDALHEVKDLAGVRVITYYPDDAERLAAELKSQFAVDAEHSDDKLASLDVDTFGYRSIHLVVSLSEPRRSLPEWKAFTEICAEIQVRSVLQHAWAAISHKLDYKVTQQAPADLRRELFRLSAMLELADELFTRLRDEVTEKSATYKKNVGEGNLTIPFDLDSLKAYLIERADLGKWYRLGTELGMRSHSLGASVVGNEAEVRRLWATAQQAKISSIGELDDLIRDIEPKARPYLQELAVASNVRGDRFVAVAVDILTVLIMIARKEHFQGDLTIEPWWRESIGKIIRELIIVKDD